MPLSRTPWPGAAFFAVLPFASIVRLIWWSGSGRWSSDGGSSFRFRAHMSHPWGVMPVAVSRARAVCRLVPAPLRRPAGCSTWRVRLRVRPFARTGRNGVVRKTKESHDHVVQSPTSTTNLNSLLGLYRQGGGEGRKDVWTRVGTMFAHSDRKGYNLLLDKGQGAAQGAEPGKLVIREDRLRAP